MTEFNTEVMIDQTSSPNLKSPIISFFGHVDAGKTSLMDCIQGTNKVSKESGGITQSIGSHFIDIKNIEEVTQHIKNKFKIEIHEIPGFIIIDTPGHGAFSSMRAQGSDICNLAILVVDINDFITYRGSELKGLQPQTKECIKLLKDKNIPFIIAANKVDKINGWINSNEFNIKKALKKQTPETLGFFESAQTCLIAELYGEEVASEFYMDNTDLKSICNIVPLSTVTKEGLSDLLTLIVFISQKFMSKKLSYRDNFKATVMRSGLDSSGHYIDVILSNGFINKSDSIIVVSDSLPKTSNIKSIFIEKIVRYGDRYKIEKESVDSAIASCGLRLYGSDLSNVVVGSKIRKFDSESLDGCDAFEDVSREVKDLFSKIEWNNEGVHLLAPSFGELDALIQIFRNEKINLLSGDIGSLNKTNIGKYFNTLEIINEKYKENRVIIYFNSIKQKIDESSELLIFCKSNNIELIEGDIIYRLLDAYKNKRKELIQHRKSEYVKNGQFSFPVLLKILDKHIYNKGGNDKSLVFGVQVLNGKLYKGVTLVTENKKSNEKLVLGKVTGMQIDKKEKEFVEKGEKVCIQLSNDNGLLYDRQFDKGKHIYTKMDRNMVDILKKDYFEDFKDTDWRLLKDTVDYLGISKKKI